MRNFLISDLKNNFRNGGPAVRLILINLGIYIFFEIAGLIGFLFRTGSPEPVIMEYLGVPSSLGSILRKPWTLFTYMFTHLDLWHIVSNLIMLWFSSRLFSEYLGQRRLIPVYIMGGLAGAILYILAFNFFPVFNDQIEISRAIGASASVFAILVAISAFIPNYTVQLILIGPVRLKYITAVLLGLDLLNIRVNNAGGHIAHLGGAILGFLFIHFYKKGKDLTVWKEFMPGKRSNMKVAYKRSITDEEYNIKKMERQKIIDEILDKISRSGYESLSKMEKEFLFKMSNEDKSKRVD